MSEAQLLTLGRDEQRSLYFNNESYQCALLSCGGAIETCSAVMERVVKNAVAVIRPPGHHAEPCRAMGFCLFNNVAVATRIMQQRYGEDCKRVLIVDWFFPLTPRYLKVGMYIMAMGRKPLSNRIRTYCTFPSIDSAYTQKIKRQKVDDTAEKEKESASTFSPPISLIQ